MGIKIWQDLMSASGMYPDNDRGLDSVSAGIDQHYNRDPALHSNLYLRQRRKSRPPQRPPCFECGKGGCFQVAVPTEAVARYVWVRVTKSNRAHPPSYPLIPSGNLNPNL